MAGGDKRYVSTTRGVTGGYIYRAPAGTAMPTDIDTPLNAALWENLGYISEDGFVEGLDRSSETIPDMNGEVVDTYSSSAKETCKFTLMDMSPNAMGVQYGSKNVSSVDGITTVTHDWSQSDETCAYVLELVLKNGRRWRKCIPAANVSEIGEFTGNSSTATGREVTLTYTAVAYDLFEDIDYSPEPLPGPSGEQPGGGD